ncbi:hypothetical protein Tco_0535981 [Tanacetum coccineum]
MENSKSGNIPMQEKPNLSKSQGAYTPEEVKCMQRVLYGSAIGSIMYAVRCTRPNVAFGQHLWAISKMSSELLARLMLDSRPAKRKENLNRDISLFLMAEP